MGGGGTKEKTMRHVPPRSFAQCLALALDPAKLAALVTRHASHVAAENLDKNCSSCCWNQ